MSKEHGYHRSCFKRFTAHPNKLEESSEASTSTCPAKVSRRSSSDKVLFSKDCIFCNKEGRKWKRKGRGAVGEDTTVFDMGGGQIIQTVAETKNDERLLTRIRGMCSFSVEAHYHPSCRKDYTRQSGLGSSMPV